MAYRAIVKADSISPAGCRITTVEATYPRLVHSEQMTHRDQNRNSASTRAIPIATQLFNLLDNPFIPEKFGINQPGMQAFRHLEGMKHDKAVEIWLRGRDRAVTTVIELILGEELAEATLGYMPGREFVPGEVLLAKFDEVKKLLPQSGDDIDLNETTLLNVHKQLAGRGLEAYMWHTIVFTATEFSNYFALRDHPDAQGEIAAIARLIRQAYDESEPRKLEDGQWHLPYVDDDEYTDVFDGIRFSAARCAATSYNRQNARNPEKEIERYDQLRSGGHMSPLEHQATPFREDERVLRHVLQLKTSEESRRLLSASHGRERLSTVENEIRRSLEFSGNLRGWRQHRKDVPFEYNFALVREA